jgi:hypothetical protein
MVGGGERHRAKEDPMTTTTTGRTAVMTAAECARERRRTRALAIVAAAGATFTVWAIARPIAGADLVVDTGSGPTTVTPLAVVLVTIIVGLAAWGLPALLERFTRRAAPRRPSDVTTGRIVSWRGNAWRRAVTAGGPPGNEPA